MLLSFCSEESNRSTRRNKREGKQQRQPLKFGASKGVLYFPSQIQTYLPSPLRQWEERESHPRSSPYQVKPVQECRRHRNNGVSG